MAKKEFQAESKRLLDLMINSIYTHKEIFLRELISNASDAIDKLYYRTLEDGATGLSRDDFFIRLELDKEARTLTVTDNGIPPAGPIREGGGIGGMRRRVRQLGGRMELYTVPRFRIELSVPKEAVEK